MAVENPAEFRAYVEKLAEVSGVEINKFRDMIDALRKRHDFFEEMGCRLSDHGIEEFYAEDFTDGEIEAIFDKVYGGKQLTAEEINKFKSAMLPVFGEMDYASGWTQQFHYGAIRNNNSKMFKLLGPDTGFDSIGEFTTAKACAKFLDTLNSRGKLTKTILYNLNPCANEVLATMLGNFRDGTIPGKIQFGSGWWFLDRKDGMEKQMNALSLRACSAVSSACSPTHAHSFHIHATNTSAAHCATSWATMWKTVSSPTPAMKKTGSTG